MSEYNGGADSNFHYTAETFVEPGSFLIDEVENDYLFTISVVIIFLEAYCNTFVTITS